jgi:RNase H-fold protein (predicted Holliday junction resolvase)
VETTRDKVVEAIASATNRREMAVVCIGPPMRMLSDDKLREEADSLERLLKEMGHACPIKTH